LGPGTLAQVLCCLPKFQDSRLLVGLDTSDDAGVYKLTDDLALIQTVDFFPPVVDDPYTFGQVAAANALSDIYAMGGTPLLALNIVGFPVQTTAVSVLGEILRGGADKILEAGAVILGGHTIEDHEPKYGLAVTGVVHPQCIVTNEGARPGDVIVLTKPLGTGSILTAVRKGEPAEGPLAEAIRLMTTLNREASQAMQEIGVNACTDITGFGLLGHLFQLARASGVALRLFFDRIPLLPGVRDFAEKGYFPGGAQKNRRYVEEKVSFSGLSPAEEGILLDPQTSGGLAIVLPATKVADLLKRLQEKGVEVASVIGEVTLGEPGKVFVTR